LAQAKTVSISFTCAFISTSCTCETIIIALLADVAGVNKVSLPARCYALRGFKEIVSGTSLAVVDSGACRA
jgi:hypothetical protein